MQRNKINIKWRVKIPDALFSWWDSIATYSNKNDALAVYRRHDNAKLIKVIEEEVRKKGSLAEEQSQNE